VIYWGIFTTRLNRQINHPSRITNQQAITNQRSEIHNWIQRLGLQFEVSHYEVSNLIDAGTVSSTDFGPSVLYAFNDHVADYTWLRPYLGAGVNFYRSTATAPTVGIETSDSQFGSQVFGGGKLSFASVPQFAISTELSYRWFDAPTDGFDLGGVGLSVAGHWYVK
jgi:hypothetical protein